MFKRQTVLVFFAVLFLFPSSSLSDQKTTSGQCSPIVENIRAKHFNLTISCNEILKLKNPGERLLSLKSLQIIGGSTSPDAIADIFGLPNDREKLQTDFDRGDEKHEKLTYRFKDGHVSRVLINEGNRSRFDESSFTVRIKPDQKSRLWNVSLHEVYKAFTGGWFPNYLVDENKKGILAFGTSDGIQIFRNVGCEFTMYGSLTYRNMEDRAVWSGCGQNESEGGGYLGFEAICKDCEDPAEQLFPEMGSELLDDYYPHCVFEGLPGIYAQCLYYETGKDALKSEPYSEVKITEGSADEMALKFWLSSTRLVQFSGGYLSKDFPY